MNPLQLTNLINYIANFIACLYSNDEINLLSVIFSQLGDTLATISTLCSTLPKCENNNFSKINQDKKEK